MQRLGGKRGHRAPQRDDVPPAIGMRTARHQDDRGAGGGVNPQRTAGPAGVPVAAHLKMIATRTRIRRGNIPTETALDFHRRLCVGRRHPLDCLLFKNTTPIQRTVIEHHVCEPAKICRGGEQACVTGHAAHPAGRGIVDFPVKNHLADLFCGGDARALG